MKCPHCNYVDGWDADGSEMGSDVKGEEGGFYKSPLPFQREQMDCSGAWTTGGISFYACPCCKKTFIESGG